MKKPPDPDSFLFHSPLHSSQQPLSLSLEALSGSMSSQNSGEGRFVGAGWWRRNAIAPEARFIYSSVRAENSVHHCDLLGHGPDLVLYPTSIAIWESHLLPEICIFFEALFGLRRSASRPLPMSRRQLPATPALDRPFPAEVPGVIFPYYLFVMSKVIRFSSSLCVLFVNLWLLLQNFPCLINCLSCFTTKYLIALYLWWIDFAISSHLESWVFDSTVFALQNMSSDFVGSLGNLKDTIYRSVSPYLSLSLSVFSSVVICEGERSGYCLIRTAEIEPTYAPNFGWVVNVSFSGCYISLFLFRILNWLTNKSLLSEDCSGSRSIIYPDMVGYTSGYLVLLGLRRSYGAVYTLSWIGYCWVLTLRVSTPMILVIPLKWYLQFSCLFCSGCPYCTSMMFVGVDVMDSGCFLIASNAGLCVSGYLDRILNWYKRILLNGKGWKGQRYIIKKAMVDYPRWSWCRTLDHRYVLMLIPLHFYGLGHILFWTGYYWVSPLRGCTNMSFVTPLKWYLQCIWQYSSGLPCSSSAYWYLDGLRCLEPCWNLHVSTRGILVFSVGAMLDCLSVWLIINGVGFIYNWHRNVMQVTGKLKLESWVIRLLERSQLSGSWRTLRGHSLQTFSFHPASYNMDRLGLFSLSSRNDSPSMNFRNLSAS